jgi:hypothetical protein
MAVLITPPYLQFFDSNGDPLNGGFVYTYAAGTDTPKATYTDDSEDTELDNPVELDSAGRATIWGSGSYKFVVKDSLGNTIETTDNVTVFNASSGNAIPSAQASGTVNAITADYSPDVSLSGEPLVALISSGENTSVTPTFSPDGNTARNIVKNGGQTLDAGDIGPLGHVALLQYSLSNTRWELLNPRVRGIVDYDSIGGLKTSNNVSDANNDIDVATGRAADSTNARYIILSSAITKRLDANWAVGTNQGGLDTSSKANSTRYYVWLIQRSDTGVVDVLFSTSASAPTMPANYDYKRVIGTILTDGSGNIRPYQQNGDEFYYATGILDVDVANLGTSRSLYTVSAPPNTVVQGRSFVSNATSSIFVIQPTFETDAAPSITAVPLVTNEMSSATAVARGNQIRIRVDGSSQFAARANNTSSTLRFLTLGFEFPRGRAN